MRVGIRARAFVVAADLLFFAAALSAQQSSQLPAPKEGDYLLHDFHFKSGETLPELRMHYMTLGKPVRDGNGRVTNAVLILHGTGGSGRQFQAPQFADVLFGPASFSMRAVTSSSFPTTLATESRVSRATACMRIFRNTTTTTWFWHS